MTNSTTADQPDIDIHAILEQRHQIAIIWSIEDVQSVRPDLDEDQSWEVLQNCKDRHDCEHGFTWFFLESLADTLFPLPEEK